ncbi:hypothetical protein Tco_0009453 [Tanacetum coccineum]
MSTHKKIFVNPFHTKKVFANMKRAGKDFSGRITPLFDTMMVQPIEEMGEDSDHPTDSTPIPIIDQHNFIILTQKNNHLKKAHETAMQRSSRRGASMRKVYQHLPMIHNLVNSKDAQARRFSAYEKEDPEGRSIEDIDADVDLSLVDETQERQNDDLMFDTGVLEDDEMHVVTFLNFRSIRHGVLRYIGGHSLERVIVKSSAKSAVTYTFLLHNSEPDRASGEPYERRISKGGIPRPEDPTDKYRPFSQAKEEKDYAVGRGGGSSNDLSSPANSAIFLHVEELVITTRGKESLYTTQPPPDITIVAMITVRLKLPNPPTESRTLRIASTQALIDAVTAALPSPPLPPLLPSLYIPPPVDRRDDIPESEQPPRKRLYLSTLGSRYKVGERSTARPTRGRGIDYGLLANLDVEERYMKTAFRLYSKAEYSSRFERLTIVKASAQMVETLLRVIRDMRREMGDMQAELLALREQQRRAKTTGPRLI